LPDTAAVLIPGLGCVNACSFCATSHHFGKKYVSYLDTGKELFATLQEIERKLGCNEFFVMDENFLKHRPRAEQFLEELERHNKYYHLGVFSSAETINAVGVEFMAKLGIDFVWVGVESKQSMFQKTKDVDLKAMIQKLRDYGIQVLGSAILFLDHHTKETIQEDIDFVIDLNTDFVQFMELGPLPGTALYEEYEQAGRLRFDMPYEDWHGQDKIWFHHPSFTREETAHYIKDAFTQEYERQGPSLLRLAETALRGYRTFQTHPDARIRGLTKRLKERCLTFRPLFSAARKFAHNTKTVEMVDYLTKEYQAEFGKEGLPNTLASAAVHVFAYLEQQRINGVGNMRQPPTKYVTYRMSVAERLGWAGWPPSLLAKKA
ncbi:MAG: radical SAM protein, partial [Candidatus Melainabacteria bacterium]|nr:radical SAM protein [Candidatus Melainabacteria bacterium]